MMMMITAIFKGFEVVNGFLILCIWLGIIMKVL